MVSGKHSIKNLSDPDETMFALKQHLPKGMDVKYLAKKNKPFFIEFWGSEIRQSEKERERNPFFSGDNSGNPKKKVKRLEFWSSMTNEVIMSDNSADIYLKPYFDKIHIVRQRVDTSLYQPIFPNPETKKPKITFKTLPILKL